MFWGSFLSAHNTVLTAFILYPHLVKWRGGGVLLESAGGELETKSNYTWSQWRVDVRDIIFQNSYTSISMYVYFLWQSGIGGILITISDSSSFIHCYIIVGRLLYRLKTNDTSSLATQLLQPFQPKFGINYLLGSRCWICT